MNGILPIVQWLADIDRRSSIPDDGENVSYPWWHVDKTFWWDYHGIIEEMLTLVSCSTVYP